MNKQVEWLRRLADDVEAGKVVIDETSMDFDIGDTTGVGSPMVTFTHSGYEKIVIKLHRPEGVRNFNKEWEANRLEGIPPVLDDALRGR